jgi:hypothetical protein
MGIGFIFSWEAMWIGFIFSINDSDLVADALL